MQDIKMSERSRQRRDSLESWESSDNPNGSYVAVDPNPEIRIASDVMQEGDSMVAPNSLIMTSSTCLSEDAQRDQARRDKYLSKIYQASHADKLKRYLQEKKMTLSDVDAMSLQQVYYTWRVLDRRFRSSAKHKNTKVQVGPDYFFNRRKKS